MVLTCPIVWSTGCETSPTYQPIGLVLIAVSVVSIVLAIPASGANRSSNPRSLMSAPWSDQPVAVWSALRSVIEWVQQTKVLIMLTDTQIAARVTRNPQILRGKPIIRGTRVPVYLIVDFVNNGVTPAHIVDDYPDLACEDVEAALAFAAQEPAQTKVRRW